MPPRNANKGLIHRVETLVEVDSPAYRNPSSYGMWIECETDISAGALADLIETPLLALYGSGTTSGLRSVMPDEGRIARTRYSKPLVDPPPVPHELNRNFPGQTGSPTVPDVAMVCSLRSDTGGPAYRGRFYLPCIRTGAIDTSGLFTVAATTIIQDAVNAFRVALPLLDPICRLVNVSRFQSIDGVPVERDPAQVVDVQLALVDIHADVQRRRGVR